MFYGRTRVIDMSGLSSSTGAVRNTQASCGCRPRVQSTQKRIRVQLREREVEYQVPKKIERCQLLKGKSGTRVAHRPVVYEGRR